MKILIEFIENHPFITLFFCSIGLFFVGLICIVAFYFSFKWFLQDKEEIRAIKEEPRERKQPPKKFTVDK